MIGRILGDGGLTIGVCFMSIFEQTGWYDVIDFDYVIDTHTSVKVLEK
jgi:hypothetical protein